MQLSSVVAITLLVSQVLCAQFDSKWLGRSKTSLAAEFQAMDAKNKSFILDEKKQVFAKVLDANPFVSVVDFVSPGQFPEDALWDILDAHSEGAFWEDVSLLSRNSLPISLAEVYRKEAGQYWALVNGYKITAVAEIVFTNGRSYLRLAEVSLNMIAEPSPVFKWEQKWDLEDFYGNKDDCKSGCILSHVAAPKVSLEIEGVNHQISLTRNLESPITVPPEFTNWSAEKQLDFIRATQSFLVEERRWILKNLLPTISHWQNWASWDYRRAFKKQKSISSKQILEWGIGGGGAQDWVVFNAKLGAHTMIWTTDLHGHYTIKIQ